MVIANASEINPFSPHFVHDPLAQGVGLGVVGEDRVGELVGEQDLLGHCPRVSTQDRTKDLRRDALAFGHRHPELRARAAILGHRPHQPRGATGIGRDPLAIPGQAHHLREPDRRTQVGGEDLAHVARVVAIIPIEGVEPFPEQPFQHGSLLACRDLTRLMPPSLRRRGLSGRDIAARVETRLGRIFSCSAAGRQQDEATGVDRSRRRCMSPSMGVN